MTADLYPGIAPTGWERELQEGAGEPKLAPADVYRQVMEHAGDVIALVDREGRLLFVNRAIEELTGAKREAWMGRSVLEALAARSVAAARARLRAVMAGQSFDGPEEYVLRTVSGRTSTLEVQMRRIELQGAVAVVIVARNVTSRKRASAHAENRRQLASLGHLGTAVAHEFNNVLMSIMPFAELLQHRLPDDPRVVESTQHILQAVRRGKQISEEVLRFARPADVAPEAVNAADWMFAFRSRDEGLTGPHPRVVTEVRAEDAVSLPQVGRRIASEEKQSARRRLVIVEDDPSVGEGLRDLLLDEGFEVELIDRGAKAEGAIEAFGPDLVLLDVNLPDVNGVEVYRRIRKRWPALTVIVSTGHPDGRFLSGGVLQDVPSILKPYEIEDLIALIGALSS